MTENNIRNREIIPSVRSEVDHFDVDGILGWACHVPDSGAPFELEVRIDTELVEIVSCNLFRPDLQELGISTGKSGFLYNFPHRFFDGMHHEVELRDYKTGEMISAGKKILEFPEKPFPTIDGRIEAIESGTTVSGWAIDKASPDRPISLEIYLDHRKILTVPADLTRPDLITSRVGTGRHGFKATIPQSLITEQSHLVSVRANGVELGSSPREMTFKAPYSFTFQGVTDQRFRVSLSGWRGAELFADVMVDGQIAGRIALKKNKGTPAGTLEGEWHVPPYLDDGKLHVFQAVVNQKTFVVRTDTVLQRLSNYKAHIDHADFDLVRGWVTRQGSINPLRVGAYIDDVLIGSAITDIHRGDVKVAYDLDTEQVGFDIALSGAAVYPSATIDLKDEASGIVFAQISIAARYESLIRLAQESARSGARSTGQQLAGAAVLSDVSLRSGSDLALEVKMMPGGGRAQPASGIDVVVPIYGGIVETAECLESVLAARNETPYRLVLVNDCTPYPLIRDYLDELERRGHSNLIVVNRTENGGFSQAVNIGMTIAGDRDVILLNADTVVYDHWIDRIVAAANRDERIATVTPLSNNGEICTAPYICKTLAIDTIAIGRTVDEGARAANDGQIVDIPVGIGFCMYVRRAAINDIGLFDADLWGRGYGEEVDFCLKASSRGWRHVIALDTYVVHRGNASFGNEKLERILESAKKINVRYPFYDHMIQRFLQNDPIMVYRRRLFVQLAASLLPEKRMLHVTHAFGGGTERYVEDMAEMAEAAGFTVFILRFKNDGSATLSVEFGHRYLVNLYEEKHSEFYKPHEVDELIADMDMLRFQALHLHSPFGMTKRLVDWTSDAPRNIYITGHDYAWVCPRVTLTTPNGQYCGEPGEADCNACVKFNGVHPGLKKLLAAVGDEVGPYRDALRSLFRKANLVFAGSADTADRLKRHGFEARYRVVPHPAPPNSVFSRSSPVEPNASAPYVTVALIGGLSDIKGFDRLLECAEYVLENKVPIKFVLFGYSKDDNALRKIGNIAIAGPYQEEELERQIRMYRPDLVYFPNQWPETFSYTLNHAFRLNLWPVVSDIGAPAERVRKANFGTVIPMEASIEETLRVLMRVAADRRKRRAVFEGTAYPTTLEAYVGEEEAAVADPKTARRAKSPKVEALTG